jgi:predicted ArsR family transcriptional regulator
MVSKETSMTATVSSSDVPLTRDLFLRSLLRELAGSLQDVVGIDEASGYISIVGASIGRQLDRAYKDALKVENLSSTQVAEVLVDLKKRIEGDFYLIEQTEDRIVLGNRRCPFGQFVQGRPSLCMMTSNVFGYIAAENLGYARVEISETIATGSAGCRVVIYLRPADDNILGADHRP